MKNSRILFCASLGLIFIASDLFAVLFGEAGVFRLLSGLMNAAVIVVIAWSGFGLGTAFARPNLTYHNRNLVTLALVTWGVASLLFRFTFEPEGSIVVAILPPLLAVFVLAVLAGKGLFVSASSANRGSDKET